MILVPTEMVILQLDMMEKLILVTILMVTQRDGTIIEIRNEKFGTIRICWKYTKTNVGSYMGILIHII